MIENPQEATAQALREIHTLWTQRKDRFRHWHGYGIAGRQDAPDLVLYVDPKTESEDLDAACAPIRQLLPVNITGQFRFHQMKGRKKSTTGKILPPGIGLRGVSAKHGPACPGTLGVFLRTKDTEPVVLLTNNHVLVKVEESPNDIAVQLPDGTVIANNVRFIPLQDSGNQVDVAIANLLDPKAASPSYKGLTVSSTIPTHPVRGDFVQKLGFRTGATCGIVRHESCTMDVIGCDDEDNIEFVDQIMIDSVPKKPPFLEKEDSGSLVVSQGGPAGLLFAISGTPTGDMVPGLANPWDTVLSKLSKIMPPPVEMMLIPTSAENPCAVLATHG